MHCLNGRVLKPELLDTLPPEEARESLADLVRINKYWGGHSTLRKLVDRRHSAGRSVHLIRCRRGFGRYGAGVCGSGGRWGR